MIGTHSVFTIKRKHVICINLFMIDNYFFKNCRFIISYLNDVDSNTRFDMIRSLVIETCSPEEAHSLHRHITK